MDSPRCFNSSDPRAVNATLMYDDRVNNSRLYFRHDQQTPLPLCSSSSFSPILRCLVCRADEIVHILCHNLEEAAELVMEALGEHVEITEGDCPNFLSDDPYSAHKTPPGGWQWQFLLIPLILLILLIFGLVYCKQMRGNKAPEDCGGDMELDLQAEPLNQEQAPGGGDDDAQDNS